MLQWSHQPLCLSLCVSVRAVSEGRSSLQSLNPDIKGYMKDKDPILSPFNSIVYYSCLHLNPEGPLAFDRGNQCASSTLTSIRTRRARYARLGSYLHHSDHAIIGNRVGANAKVPGRVSVDDPVDGVPIRRVRLICIYNCQVSHHKIHPVLWDLSRKLQKSRVKHVTL